MQPMESNHSAETIVESETPVWLCVADVHLAPSNSAKLACYFRGNKMVPHFFTRDAQLRAVYIWYIIIIKQKIMD